MAWIVEPEEKSGLGSPNELATNLYCNLHNMTFAWYLSLTASLPVRCPFPGLACKWNPRQLRLEWPDPQI